ncbi:MAG: DUF4350 domain-containing protein [Candidatus Heimdallarchaeaceae archaeon]
MSEKENQEIVDEYEQELVKKEDDSSKKKKVKKAKVKRKSKKPKKKFKLRKVRFTKYSLAMTLLFLIVIVPLFIGLVGLGGRSVKFSIYNTGWDGLSTVYNTLQAENKYEISNGMSSLTILNRLNSSGVLVVIGPTTSYNFAETISLVTFLVRGGSLIVADDFGSGNKIFEPLWNVIATYDSLVSLGLVPSLTDIFFGNQSAPSNVTSVEDLAGAAIFEMLAGMLKAIGFNQTVLMDAGSNYGGVSSQPLLKDTNPDNPLTAGITKGVQMEFGTVLSVKINNSRYNPSTGRYEWYTDWVPLQPLSINVTIEGGEYGNLEPIFIEDVMLPFLSFFTTTTSWMESNFRDALTGEAVPNEGEWGNTAFAPILSIPIGRGKIVMIGDPDIFINKWIEDTENNDNLQFCQNLFNYVTENMVANTTSGKIPIIFDEGHTQYKFYSPALVSTILMRLITEMSMYPLYSPFVPIMFAVIAYPLIPKARRLAPVLWTRYRGERGRSRFEREIKRILETGSYSEAVGLLYRSMLRGVRKVDASAASSPKSLADFFISRGYPLKRGALVSEFERIDRYLQSPKLLPQSEFEKMLQFIKNLIDTLPK